MELDKLLSLDYILKDFNIVKTIQKELLIRFQGNPQNKELSIHRELDSIFSGVDLTKSFNEKIVIVYDEIMYLEILLGLHSWLFKKSCNIENIVLVVTHHIGISEWYNQYLKLYSIKGVKLLEAPLLAHRYLTRFNTIKPFKLINRDNTLNYYFSFYGGTHNSWERDFLTACMIKTNMGFVDYMCGFSEPMEKFDNYLEQLFMFMNRKTMDEILSIRNTAQFDDSKDKMFNEKFSNDGYQYRIDSQCAGQVIRESLNGLPYSSITEKTIRSFLHQQIPIPLGIKNVENLSKLGFDMGYNVINYDYQFEGNFLERIIKVCDELILLKNTYTLTDINDIMIDKKDLIEYNYNYIHSTNLYKNIAQRLLEDING